MVPDYAQYRADLACKCGDMFYDLFPWTHRGSTSLYEVYDEAYPTHPRRRELLDILEGRRPPDLERFHSLVALLMERHWYALVTHIDKRCSRAGNSAEDIAVDTFVKAYEFLQQQITRQRDMASNASAMCYSRFQCPHFLGFMKALARWGHLDTARKTHRYRTLIDAWERQAWSQTQQRGTWRSHTNGQRIRASLRMALAMISPSSGSA